MFSLYSSEEFLLRRHDTFPINFVDHTVYKTHREDIYELKVWGNLGEPRLRGVPIHHQAVKTPRFIPRGGGCRVGHRRVILQVCKGK
jgi:hypothetical protein